VNRNYLILTIIVLAIVVLAMPLITKDPRNLHILIIAGIAVILATGLHLSQIVGLFNLGQAAFFAIGAYSLFLLRLNLGLSFWVTLPLAGMIAGIIALGLGFPFVKVKGVYFVMLSLALVEVVRLTIIAVPFLGGYRTIIVPPIEPILGVDLNSKIAQYYLMLGLVAITLVVLYRIQKSRIGATLKCIADNEPLAQSLGMRSSAYKVLAFSIASFFAGIAGGFYATYMMVIGPNDFTVWTSIRIFMWVVVGGMGFFWGPLIGAVFLTFLSSAFLGMAEYETIIVAIIIILVIFFLPGGIVTIPRLVQKRVIWPIRAKFIKSPGTQNPPKCPPA
jgi:branched-chain amino acid transport system permease protein